VWEKLKRVRLLHFFLVALALVGLALPVKAQDVIYERGWFVTQGLILQGFRYTPVFREEEAGGEHGSPAPVSYVRPTISDGDHVSVRWKRLTIGGAFEHIHFREGDEWKGGGRLAVRMFSRLSAIVYVLGPGRTEWRGGILIHPPPRD
jgi:hypothetical protein